MQSNYEEGTQTPGEGTQLPQPYTSLIVEIWGYFLDDDCMLSSISFIGGCLDLNQDLFMAMICPSGTDPDKSPLHMLCCNDTCSFTWTGTKHINQDIFECKTCGLVGPLCCCTECAQVCHIGHECK